MYRPTVVTNVPTMLGKLLEHDAELRGQGKPGLDFSSIRFSLSRGRGAARAAPLRWIERFRERRLRRHRLRRDVPHLRLEPPRRREDRLARQGRRRLRAPRLARGRRRARRADVRAPDEIGVLWVKGDSVSRWATGSIATRAGRRSSATGAARAISSASTKRATCTSQVAPTTSSRWAACGSRPLEVEECLLEHEAVAAARSSASRTRASLKTKAFVVLRAGSRRVPALATELQEHVRDEAGKVQVPARHRVRRRSAQERSRQGRREGAARREPRRELTWRAARRADDDEVRALARRRSRRRARARRQRRAARSAPSARHRHHSSARRVRARAADRLASATSVRRGRRAERAVRRHRLRARASRARSACPPRRSPRFCVQSASDLLATGFAPRVLREQPPRARARRRRPRRDRRACPRGAASVACPLTRRWGRTLSDEFKRGDCHAGSLRDVARPRRAARCARSRSSDCRPSTRASPRRSAPARRRSPRWRSTARTRARPRGDARRRRGDATRSSHDGRHRGRRSARSEGLTRRASSSAAGISCCVRFLLCASYGEACSFARRACRAGLYGTRNCIVRIAACSRAPRSFPLGARRGTSTAKPSWSASVAVERSWISVEQPVSSMVSTPSSSSDCLQVRAIEARVARLRHDAIAHRLGASGGQTCAPSVPAMACSPQSSRSVSLASC